LRSLMSTICFIFSGGLLQVVLSGVFATGSDLCGY
jgi:hypothetical protein